MTIHKSQGSEFTRVLLLLPDVEDSPLLGRELLYTAVTRAKKEVILIGDNATINKCLNRTMDNNLDLIRYSTLSRHCQDIAVELPEFDLEVDREPEPF
jgi:exodeoxyribonuclease V alpha subunit